MTARHLRQLAANWNAFGATDPLWAILSHEDKRGNRWDLDAFLRTGREEVAAALAWLDSLRPGVPRRRALDFGCGVGRLTQALAEEFAHVDGVDIAASMIERARELDAGSGSCSYHLNVAPDLALFGDASFDFVYSNLTLQHMPPPLTLGYLDELCRVLAPRGALVFDLPERPRRIRSRLGRFASRALRPWIPFRHRVVRGEPVMDMYGVVPATVTARVERTGCQVVARMATASAGPDWISHRYCVAR